MSSTAGDGTGGSGPGSGWEAVNQSWERVFSAVSELGADIANTYRDAYRESSAAQAESKAKQADKRENEPENAPEHAEVVDLASERRISGQASDIADTVGESLNAARSAFDTSMQKLAASEKGRTLTTDVTDALRLSLAQLGETFTELSDAIGRQSAEGDAGPETSPGAKLPSDNADTGPAEGGEDGGNVLPGPGADRDPDTTV